jgi:hypothetical protein
MGFTKVAVSATQGGWQEKQGEKERLSWDSRSLAEGFTPWEATAIGGMISLSGPYRQDGREDRSTHAMF